VTTNRHPGNESFRSLVGLNKELYVTSTKRQKMSISRSIVEAVRSMDPVGRFLEKNPSTGLWSDIGDRKAIEKTSQALRDGAAALRKQLSEDLGDPDFLNVVFDMEKPAKSSESSDSDKSDSSTSKNKSKLSKLSKSKGAKKGNRTRKSNTDTLPATKKKAVVKHKKSGEPNSPHPRGSSPHSTPRSSPQSDFHSPMGRFDERRSPNSDEPMKFLHAPPPRFQAFHEPNRGQSFLETPYYARSNPGMQWSPNSTRSHSAHPSSSSSPSTGQGGLHQPSPSPYEQSQRPPLSPVASPRNWGVRPFPFNQSPLSATPTLGWRKSSAPYTPYSNGDILVPDLDRDDSSTTSSPRSMSPVSSQSSGSGHRASTPPQDFAPPPLSPMPRTPRPTSRRKVPKQDCSTVSVSTEGTTKEKASGRQVCLASGGTGSPTVVVEMDDSRLDSNSYKPEVEVIAGALGSDDFPRDQNAYSEENSAAGDSAMTPLPFDDGGPDGYMDISDDLLQLPIAPCGPGDVQ